MSDPPVTLSVLAAFHRDVILPDMQRVVLESEHRLEHRLMGHIDGLAHRLENFETDTRVGLARLEARLGEVEHRLGRVEDRLGRVEARLDGVEGRLTVLENQYAHLLAAQHRLEDRLRRVEARVDQVASATEKLALKSEVADLAIRVDALAEEVRRLEQRLDAAS